jgi:sulfoxide reductase catalytic subunit YedY
LTTHHEPVHLSRRQVLKQAGLLAAAGLAWVACKGSTPAPAPTPMLRPSLTPKATRAPGTGGEIVDEFGDPATPLEKIRRWGNYYELTRSNEGIGEIASTLTTSPWQVQVGGLVHAPKTFDLDDLRKFGEEERVYRLRCAQAWSMVIPWLGFPLHRLLSAVEPTAEAGWVRFEAQYAPQEMPGQDTAGARYAEWLKSGGENVMGHREVEAPYVWPYVEALRLDEAMHDLTMMATGYYGQPLHPENGAPLRLVVPWKYAFKSIKAVVKIDLVAERPVTFWNRATPAEMGFWANVNPDVPHPRWKQGREMRMLGRDPEPILSTLPFNGYAEQVAHLYEGMDLRADF